MGLDAWSALEKQTVSLNQPADQKQVESKNYWPGYVHLSLPGITHSSETSNRSACRGHLFPHLSYTSRLNVEHVKSFNFIFWGRVCWLYSLAKMFYSTDSGNNTSCVHWADDSREHWPSRFNFLPFDPLSLWLCFAAELETNLQPKQTTGGER